jgi:hypothetical protein
MNLCSIVAGRPIQPVGSLTVRSPYSGEIVGTVGTAAPADTEAAIAAAVGFKDTPSRYQRSEILGRTLAALESRREEFARTISSEAGLALREGRYEVGRTIDVLRFASIESLRDDGQIFSCDISAQGKSRTIFTTRDPLRCAAPARRPQVRRPRGGRPTCPHNFGMHRDRRPNPTGGGINRQAGHLTGVELNCCRTEPAHGEA